MIDNWLTVAQAAQHLGISERQARRYAARLAPVDREEGPDATPDMGPDTKGDNAGREGNSRPARRPARVRLEAMRAARDGATKRQNPQITPENSPDAPDITTKELDRTPDAMTAQAGHASGLASNVSADWQERAADYKSEIQFLRGLVEQRDRDAAELRLALREALKAYPRQLTSGEPSSMTPPETSAPMHQVVAAPQATPKVSRETRQVQKRRAFRGLLQAFFGVDKAVKD